MKAILKEDITSGKKGVLYGKMGDVVDIFSNEELTNILIVIDDKGNRFSVLKNKLDII